MKDYKLKSGNILRVIQDENAESPDTWDNEDMFLVYDHRQFAVSREGFDPNDIYNYLEIKSKINSPIRLDESVDELEDDLKQYFDYDSAYYIFPVDAYIHSDIHLSLANTKDYPDRKWDVSTTGYILVKKDQILPEYNMGVAETALHWRAKEMAEGLIETWNQYLSGDVYGFQVLKPVKTYTITEEELNYVCNRKLEIKLSELSNISKENIEYEEINSCWGFYGDDPKTNGMLDHIDDEIIEELKEETL
jgi:hypothetical protein